MDDLTWLGLDWDEGPHFQSARGAAYDAAIATLTAMGLTYPCFCSRQELHAATAPHASDGGFVYPGTCRGLGPDDVFERSREKSPALRLRVPMEGDPKGVMAFDDLVFGHQVESLASECGDFLVRRSDGVVAYQLAVVVDDADMGVNLVVRGADLLGSVARQRYLQDLLGLPHPVSAHVPLLVTGNGRRLSKRDRDLDLGLIRSKGDGPEYLLGRLASLVGMASPGERITAHELIGRFDWDLLRGLPRRVAVGEDFSPLGDWAVVEGDSEGYHSLARDLES